MMELQKVMVDQLKQAVFNYQRDADLTEEEAGDDAAGMGELFEEIVARFLPTLASQSPPPTDDARAREMLVNKGWELHRRALSYATGIPAANMLLGECGEFAKAAAEALSAQLPPPTWTREELARAIYEEVEPDCGCDAACPPWSDMPDHQRANFADAMSKLLAASPLFQGEQVMTREERLGLEPGSMSDDPKHESPADFVVLHSTAISLKRIADALDGATKFGSLDVRVQS